MSPGEAPDRNPSIVASHRYVEFRQRRRCTSQENGVSRIRKGRFLIHPSEGACGHGSAGDAVACGIGRRSTKRRALVIALGAQAIGVPLAARAQPQTAKPARVAWLLAASPEAGEYLVDVFTRRMREMGYVEGKDVMYELRWARGKAERFPELAQELVALRPDVILATGGHGAIQRVARDK